MPGKTQPMGNLHNHTNVSATGIKASRMDTMKGKSSKGVIKEKILLPSKSKPFFPSIPPAYPFSIQLFPGGRNSLVIGLWAELTLRTF